MEYSDLDYETWHMLTGLPPEAYVQWEKFPPHIRQEIVEIFQSPDELDAIRKA